MKLLKTKIVLGFPGIGKSYAKEELSKKGYVVTDLDSSDYSHIYDENNNQISNPEFPDNYIQRIKELYNDKKTDVIFISTHKQVRDMLNDTNLPFTIIYPSKRLLNEYVGRFYRRGSDKEFIDKIIDNFKSWITEIDKMELKNRYSKKMKIKEYNIYVMDILYHLGLVI